MSRQHKLIVVKEAWDDEGGKGPVAIPIKQISHLYAQDGDTYLVLKENIQSDWRGDDAYETCILRIDEDLEDFVSRYNEMLSEPEPLPLGDDF